MNSIISKKGVINLALCLMAALSLAGCSSTPSRSIAEEHKSDVSRIEDGVQVPHTFHGNRFEKYNEY